MHMPLIFVKNKYHFWLENSFHAHISQRDFLEQNFQVLKCEMHKHVAYVCEMLT